MCKTGHEYTANEETRELRAPQNKTKREKVCSRKMSCAQHHKIMKKHAAVPEPRAEQNTTHTDRGELETARSHSKTKPGV